jgi:type II secretory pathway component GspD/PulD (secretin)
MITDGRARLLSDLKVVTQDNVPAEIFAGETVPVVITSLQSPGAGGTLQTVQLEKIDVGVKLNITPRVSGDGYITTRVQPEISRIVAFRGANDDLPQTSTRRARTLVRVRDGERIYLGGLLAEEQRRTVKKVPLLGHIPLLGYLFSHYRNETVRLDLVIEVTPQLVGDEGASN